jgi:hypothetical protein
VNKKYLLISGLILIATGVGIIIWKNRNKSSKLIGTESNDSFSNDKVGQKYTLKSPYKATNLKTKEQLELKEGIALIKKDLYNSTKVGDEDAVVLQLVLNKKGNDDYIIPNFLLNKEISTKFDKK